MKACRSTALVHRQSQRRRAYPVVSCCAASKDSSNNRLPAALVTLKKVLGTRALAGALSALMIVESTGHLLQPPPAQAALYNPDIKLPRNAEVALRRAIPAINQPTAAIQERLEGVAYMLRIPQRKPWGTMSDEIRASRAAIAASRALILASVPAAERDGAGAELIDDVDKKLQSAAVAITTQDADRTAARLADALGSLADLEILQAPGLPYALPAQYAGRPRLQGRATVEVVFSRGAPGETFQPLSDGQGPRRTASVTVTLDGYNAPLTAGNFIMQVEKGTYNGLALVGPLAREGALLVTAPAPAAPMAAADALPLEFRTVEEFEPRYRVPVDALGGGEMPILPMSVYGSLAAARGPNGNDSDPASFFFYRYQRQTGGLGGLSFEEGSFSVFGYVTEGEELLKQLQTGDKIVSAKILTGRDRLIVPSAAAGAAAPPTSAGQTAAAAVASS